MDDTFVPDTDPNSETIIDNLEPERLQLYRNIIQETVNKFVSCVSLEEYEEQFKDLEMFKNKPEAISTLYNTLTEFISNGVNSDFEKHIVADEVENKFMQLNEMIRNNSSTTNTTAWKPSHDVSSNQRSYIMAEKIKQRDHLLQLVAKEEDKVINLKFDVQIKRDQVKKMGERLKNSVTLMERMDQQLSDVVNQSTNPSMSLRTAYTRRKSPK